MIKYADLPSANVLKKLIATSFSPSYINLWAYKFYKALLEPLEFLENERRKIIIKLGEETSQGEYRVKQENINEFKAEIAVLLNLSIDTPIPYYPLTEENFSEDCCVFSKERSEWLSASDIGIILEFVNKLKEEK